MIGVKNSGLGVGYRIELNCFPIISLHKYVPKKYKFVNRGIYALYDKSMPRYGIME